MNYIVKTEDSNGNTAENIIIPLDEYERLKSYEYSEHRYQLVLKQYQDLYSQYLDIKNLEERVKVLQAECDRLKELEKCFVHMTTEASVRLDSLELAIIANDEYESLKKLDENVKREISRINDLLKMGDECPFLFSLVKTLQILESLYE